MSASVPTRWRWSWGYTPFVVIGAAAIANTVMIVTSHSVRPERVAENPYLDSQRFDAHKESQARFQEAGLTLTVELEPHLARLTLRGIATGPLLVARYRPADARLDGVISWPDPSVPLELDLVPGPWRLTISTTGAATNLEVSRDIVVPHAADNGSALAL